MPEKKHSEATVENSPAETDRVVGVKDPSGTPLDRLFPISGVRAAIPASETEKGTVEMATTTEAAAGTDTARAVTAAGVKAYTDGRLASQAEAEAGTDTAKLMTPERVAQALAALVSAASGSMFANVLRNPSFLINQRAFSSGGTASGANEYALDRWRIINSGEALSWSDSGGVRTVTVPTNGIEQIIEGALLESGTYTISWTGTATCTVGGVSKTSGDTFSVTAGTNVSVKFFNGTVSKPVVNLGSEAEAWIKRPDDIELTLCKRYYQIVDANAYFYNISSSSRITTNVNFAVEMRAAPTATYVSGSGTLGNVSGTPSLGSITTRSASFDITSNTANTTSALGCRFTLNAELTS